MVIIIISLSGGERREDERNSDYFGSVGCVSSLGCRARASGVGSPVLPIQEMHLAEGRGDHDSLHVGHTIPAKDPLKQC